MTMTDQTPGHGADDAVVAERLRRWFAGEPTPGPRGVDLLDAVAERGVPDTAGPAEQPPGSLLIHAADDAVHTREGVTALPYDGELVLSGGEIGLGPLIIQLESYAASPYVSLSCPTVVTVVDDVDRDALCTDVRGAVDQGVFPQHLVHPLTTVLDETTWIGLPSARRAVVRGDGTQPIVGAAEPGPGGLQLLGNGAENEALRTGPAGADIARFLGAARLLRGLRHRLSGTVRVAGFGFPLVDAVPTDRTRTDHVFVLEVEGSWYVTDLATGAVHRTPGQIASLVEHTYAGAPVPDDVLDALGGQEGVCAVLDKLGLAREVASRG